MAWYSSRPMPSLCGGGGGGVYEADDNTPTLCRLVVALYSNKAHVRAEAEFINVKRTISLRFLGIILRVLRLEVSVYNVYITNSFQTTFARGGGGG
jgi:hypothetical protein